MSVGDDCTNRCLILSNCLRAHHSAEARIYPALHYFFTKKFTNNCCSSHHNYNIYCYYLLYCIITFYCITVYTITVLLFYLLLRTAVFVGKYFVVVCWLGVVREVLVIM